MRYLEGSIAVVVFVFGFGCGASPKPATTSNGGDPSGGGGGEVSTVGSDPTPESICARVFELKASSCDLTSGYDLTHDECVADFHKSFEDRGPDARTANISLGRCLIDNASCEAAAQCVDGLSTATAPDQFRECGTGGIEPIAMPRDEWTKRKAATVTRFSQATSTKEEPIETCGIWEDEGQLDWLMSMRCEDGSQPFDGAHQAHASRAGNVGAGGRCGSIIDLYEVPCPEGTYSIYIDAYVCPKD
ncbi:MAG TPA: hypothetical protein VM261_08285 [Kofleriaceae bacterium]|nr:hypothetical protein [Kofleriaceae bacterium]